ncbi:MAG: DegV family protein [Clostridia bacterium]|nr:DegV family protein [Clostridia bacterium]
MKIKVTADSTCDLSQELLDRYDITTVPLYILKDGKEYRDGVDITPKDIFAHVAAGGDLCSTAAVNVADYIELFEKFSKDYEAVFHIDISSDFSCCYQNACTAAEEFDNVYVIDSRNLSSGQGHVVVEAAIKGAQMDDPKKLYDYLVRLTERVEASFVMDKLDYMRKGGRCSAVALLGANILQLKPCIEVVDGKMGVAKKYRGSFEKCLDSYLKDRLQGRDDIVYERIFITHPACDEYVGHVREEIKKYGNFKEIDPTHAGCTVSCHCGPGTLGVLFIRKE